jgi:thiol:disulfide interchange protein DsbC
MIVFTDYTCPYCQRLHRDIQKFNEAGITVRYLMFPRVLAYGENDPRAEQAIEQFSNAWCALDQRTAFDELFATGRAPETDCANLDESIERTDPPVTEHYQLGKLLNLTGTPLILLPDGRTITGYRGFAFVRNEVLGG